MAKDRTTITIDTDVKEAIDAFKGENMNYSDLLRYFTNLYEYRIELKGSAKAEFQLRDWLLKGYDRKITASELRQVTGVDLNACKKVLEAYVFEVEEFNNNLNV